MGHTLDKRVARDGRLDKMGDKTMATLYSHPPSGPCGTHDPMTRSRLAGRVSTKRGTLVCRRCGMPMTRHDGARFGVFAWTGRGDYREPDAVAIYATEAPAERKARTLGAEYVVRVIYR